MLYESLGFNNGYFGWKPNFAISQLPSVEINEENQTFDYDAGFLYIDDVFVVVVRGPLSLHGFCCDGTVRVRC